MCRSLPGAKRFVLHCGFNAEVAKSAEGLVQISCFANSAHSAFKQVESKGQKAPSGAQGSARDAKEAEPFDASVYFAFSEDVFAS